MILINSNEELLPYIPNSIKEVKGEKPLFDKLEPFLKGAERWMIVHFIPEELLETFAELAAPIVVYEAYRQAIPHLDLVLTANGFATVGSQNLSPASKMRADRLVAGLLAQRDQLIDLMLPHLAVYPEWRSSPQAKWFAATLFPFLNIVQQVGSTEPVWQQYQSLRSRIIDIESSLAEEFFSQELLAALRPYVQSGEPLSPKRQHFVETLRYAIVNLLMGLPTGYSSTAQLATLIDRQTMTDLVNFVRLNPDEFPEWQESNTSHLFTPPVFRNNKFSSGYFF